VGLQFIFQTTILLIIRKPDSRSMVMGCMHAVGHCLQRRGLLSDGGAIPRMEHAKRRSASTSLFLHRAVTVQT